MTTLTIEPECAEDATGETEKPTTRLVRLRPSLPADWATVGTLMVRIQAFIRKFQLESDPEIVVKHLTSFWAAGAETVAFWAMITSDGVVVGHLVAVMESLWGVPSGMVMQAEVDRPYILTAQQRTTLLSDVSVWAKAQGATSLRMLTPRDPDAFFRHSGFVFERTLLRLSLEATG